MDEMDKEPITAETLKSMYHWHLRHSLASSPLRQTPRVQYQGFSQALRDYMVGNWMDTQDAYQRGRVRRVYYLSLEFLIGRLLGNNAINMQLDDQCRKALEDNPLDWDAIQDMEQDAGLGNGGLGRLAACFMDSMATLKLPCVGYGLRYDYGIFKQLIVNGAQVEEPDMWKSDDYPWEIKRPEYSAYVYFGGETRQIEYRGKMVWRWYPHERICGVPYDVPIVGFGGKTVNNLRLWQAVADSEFDFQNFNNGSYFASVEKQVSAGTLTRVLYPNDNTSAGKELRLRQQYFFVASTLQDIFRRHKVENKDLRLLPEKIFIQLNDTHPTLVIPEMMRLLVDEEEMEWDEAWKITRSCTGYTNHTVLPEALETWKVDMLERLLPRHMQIIYEINSRFLHEMSLKFPGNMAKLVNMSIIQEHPAKVVRMAHLALIGSCAVNGVAQIHSDILKERLFKDFAELEPDKFQNKTNGITQRRWLRLANPELAALITSRIGEGWMTELDELRRLEAFQEDEAFLEAFAAVKAKNKQRLAPLIRETLGIDVDADSLFDVQVKRLHEYKRQLLLVLYIIILYNRILKHPEITMQARTFIFAAKAAPGYDMAKLIIRLIHGVANAVNNHPVASQKLHVVFMPDYRVSLAEKIIPAADVSEQISLAGTEASGTGNMKLMLNGALTVGTMDGANIEIYNEVGPENIFIFGMTADEVAKRRSSYSPWDIYNANEEIRGALDAIKRNVFSPLSPEVFDPIVRSLLDFGDHYMLLADLESYMDVQEKVEALYADRRAWTKKSLLNVASAGKFSSDRTIREYARDIWHIEPFEQN